MPYFSKPGHQAVEHAEQRAGGALELDHLARQLVDAPGHLGVAAEDLGLDLVDVVLEPGDDRRVAVDDAVEDGVQDRLGAEAQQLGVALHAAADGGQVGGLAVADGEHEVRADEDVDLAELDLLDLVEVAGGAQHHEQGVAVALQLGALVGDDRVLDGQLVQAELLGDGQQLAPRPAGTARSRPWCRGWSRRRRAASATVERAVDPAAVAVDGGVDDALLHRRGGVLGPRLHRHLGRRRLPLPVGAAAEAQTAVRAQDTGTALGHGESPIEDARDAGTGDGTAHRHVPPGRRRRAAGVSRDSEVGYCSQRPHLQRPRRRTDRPSLSHS